jgi:hypothetical protein
MASFMDMIMNGWNKMSTPTPPVNGAASNGYSNSGVAGGEGIMLDENGNLINSGAVGFDPLKQGSGTGLDTGFGWNIGTGLTALGGLSALSNIYGANKAQKLAEDQFKFTKSITNTNLNNQIKSYNTSLADRLNSRGAMQGDSAAATQAEIEKNRLSR